MELRTNIWFDLKYNTKFKMRMCYLVKVSKTKIKNLDDEEEGM